MSLSHNRVQLKKVEKVKISKPLDPSLQPDPQKQAPEGEAFGNFLIDSAVINSNLICHNIQDLVNLRLESPPKEIKRKQEGKEKNKF